MKQILLISNTPEFVTDIQEQVAKHIPGFEIVTDTLKPDMVIVDQDQKHLKDFPKVPNILLTSETDVSGNFVTIQKPFRLVDFFKNLISIIQRFENTAEGYLSFNQYELRPSTKEIYNHRNSELIKLTEREVAILKYLYKHQENMVTKNDLLENVWGYNKDASTHTIETHIYRLRQKIEHDDEKAQVIETQEGGYKLII